MLKLNVYVNYPIGSCCGGLIVVAANNTEEAHKMCMENGDLEYAYWKYEWVAGRGKSDKKIMESHFDEKSWEIVPNLTYDGVPCVIASNFYEG